MTPVFILAVALFADFDNLLKENINPCRHVPETPPGFSETVYCIDEPCDEKIKNILSFYGTIIVSTTQKLIKTYIDQKE